MTQDVLEQFHPWVARWFRENIGAPSLPQKLGWPEIRQQKNTLIVAPTGAGKTLAAFMEGIQFLVSDALAGNLSDQIAILYVSPLKALNHDIHKNLAVPLQGIQAIFAAEGIELEGIRHAVRTGDTPTSQRAAMLKKPPHILITTPESLFLMLTSERSAAILRNVRYLILDEIHALLGTKRGAHLALSVERLCAACSHEPVRIGLSATVHPMELAAEYLGGADASGNLRPVSMVAPEMSRIPDLLVQNPTEDFRVLEENSIWPEINKTLYQLVCEHTTSLIFVNNRATAEKVSGSLNMMAGDALSLPHHGSLSRTRRIETENQFKEGQLRAMVATSTLELGIDVGSVDLMIQVASPPTPSAGLQRLGRSGHRLSAVSKGRILPKTRGDLLRAAFMAHEMMAGQLEPQSLPDEPLDVLAQHLVSAACTGARSEDSILQILKGAASYRTLSVETLRSVLSMLSGDFEHASDIPVKPRLVWDRINGTISGTPYSRMLAVSSGGTIPDRGYFPVVLPDGKTRLGELDEEFVFESRAGDIFMLGNTPWRITTIDKDRVSVEPTAAVTGARVPFWKGDGTGGHFVTGQRFGAFLSAAESRMDSPEMLDWLKSEWFVDDAGAANIRDYLHAQKEAAGVLSGQNRVVVEHLFEGQDQKILIHAHFGGRVNATLAVLFQQAIEQYVHVDSWVSHTEDMILIHVYGCPDKLSGLFAILKAEQTEQILLKMLPSTTRFALSFRYNAYRALMMGTRNHAQRLPLWIQRLRSVDTLENARKTMNHPLILETFKDCLNEAFDAANTARVLRDIAHGKIEVVECETMFPSPFASEIIFAFQSVMLYSEKDAHPVKSNRRLVSGIDALHLSQALPQELPEIPQELWTQWHQQHSAEATLRDADDPDALHSLLMICGEILKSEMSDSKWVRCAVPLAETGRGIIEEIHGNMRLIAAEEYGLYAAAESRIPVETRVATDASWTREEACLRILRRICRYRAPVTEDFCCQRLAADRNDITQFLYTLTDSGQTVSWHEDKSVYFCHLMLYEQLRKKSMTAAAHAVQAAESSDFADYMARRHRIGCVSVSREEALYDAILCLEGLYLPADQWEGMVFPARVERYQPQLLDRLSSSGRIFWRIMPGSAKVPLLAWFTADCPDVQMKDIQDQELQEVIQEEAVLGVLRHKGACFTHAIAAATGLASSALLPVLKKLCFEGRIANDAFGVMRFFLTQNDKTDPARQARRVAGLVSSSAMGRWEYIQGLPEPDEKKWSEYWFRRYGLISKETAQEPRAPGWGQMYPWMKAEEYAGKVVRGYYVSGISGIQFTENGIKQEFRQTGGDVIVLSAADPACAWGLVLERPEGITFQRLVSTLLVLKRGCIVLIVERWGESWNFTASEHQEAALAAVVAAFHQKRIWPERKKISVTADGLHSTELMELLRGQGFERTPDGYVLWRKL